MSGVRSAQALKDKFASGARWTIALRLIDRGLGFASTLLLARLLTPEDFGVVAMGTSIQAILLAATEFGVSPALIQRSDTDREAYDTAWTLLIIANALVALALVSVIPLALSWYDDARVGPVMAFLAVGGFLASFRNVGLVLYEREMDFRPIFVVALTRKLAGVLVAAICALLMGNYWALLAGVFAGVVVEVGLSFRVSSYRPRFSLAKTRELMGFSKWWLSAQFFGHVSRRGEDFLVGGQLGAQQLGQYSIAFEFATLPTTEIVAPVSRAVLPGYVKLKEHPERMFAAFVRVWGAVALVALPSAAGIYCLSGLITRVILGPKWVGIESLLGLLALLGASHAMLSAFWPFVLALKGPKAVFVIAFGGCLLSIPLFAALLVFHGLHSAVVGSIASSWLYVAGIGGWLARSQRVGALTLCVPLIRPGLATGLMVAALLVTQPGTWLVTSWSGELASLVLGVVLGACVYAVSLILIWLLSGRPSGAERDVLEMLNIPRFVRR